MTPIFKTSKSLAIMLSWDRRSRELSLLLLLSPQHHTRNTETLCGTQLVLVTELLDLLSKPIKVDKRIGCHELVPMYASERMKNKNHKNKTM